MERPVVSPLPWLEEAAHGSREGGRGAGGGPADGAGTRGTMQEAVTRGTW